MACDPDFADVVLLLHCDGTNGSTVFPDSSDLANVVTANNGAVVDTAEDMFGTGSCAISPHTANFNGTSQAIQICLTTPITTGGDNDVLTGGGDFTIECWFMQSTLYDGAHYFLVFDYGNDSFSDSHNGIYLEITPTSAKLIPNVPSWSSITDTTLTIPFGVWHHVAVCRASGNAAMYIDGNAVGGGAVWTASGASPAQFTVGCTPAQSGFFGTGWVDEIRITKGLARYTSNFTPPTSEFGGVCIFPVPDILGDSPSAANAAIEAADYTVGTIGLPVPSSLYPAGTVATQSPLAGATPGTGAPVSYALSLGSGGGSAYGKFVAAPAVLDAIVVANIGDIEPKVWLPVGRQTFRSGS